MNRSLKAVTRTVFAMFIALFFAFTLIQFVQADELRLNPMNGRTLKNSYSIERGSILVAGEPVAQSTPTGDKYRYLREYPGGALYAPVTGYYSRTQGMSGLENAMNAELSGSGNSQFFTRLQNTLNGVKPQGSSVETTIDPLAQKTAYDALTSKNLEGAVVALDPKTGKILALVSTPSFDPNLLSGNDDAEIITQYRTFTADPLKPLNNRAIAGDLYHPGSVFKLIDAAAAIEGGHATPTTEFLNPAELPLPQSSAVMHNASLGSCGPGTKVSMQNAIMRSCNIPFAELAMQMPLNEIPKMAADFGYGKKLEIPLPVTPSQAPLPIDKAQAAQTAIGQLSVQATPMQVAMVSATIANGGQLMKPQLVNRVISPDLRVESAFKAEEYLRPITKETSQQITGMMELSTTGPAGLAPGARIPNVRVAAKTGTAENGNDQTGKPLPYTIWFTGFAPIDNPRVAVAVVVEKGGGATFNYVEDSSGIPTTIGKQVMEAVLKQ